MILKKPVPIRQEYEFADYFRDQFNIQYRELNRKNWKDCINNNRYCTKSCPLISEL